MKHLIIGGVAGGATAAARIRRIDEKAEIILFEKGPYISYANCGLPYYIGDVIKDRENLFVQTPESFGTRFKIDVRINQEVVGIDAVAKTITVRCESGETYEETYDKLLLSPGSTPVRPPLPGIDCEGIFTLRNVQDTDRIKTYVTQHRIKKAIVVGGGFIGLEMAENLRHIGAEVSLVEMSNQVMAPIDFSMAQYVHSHLIDKGVRLCLNKGVTGFERKNGMLQVSLNSGETLSADIILLSIGVRPDTTLAEKAGIEIERGIKVNAYLETSQKDIYAVGDAIEYPHPLTGEAWLNYLAGPANRQGRLVADNMVKGNVASYEGSIGTSVAKVFDLTVAATGLTAKRLKQLDKAYATSITTSGSHAGYYPGAFQMTIKLVFSPTDGKLLGTQIVGRNGVDKRIDQAALIIKHGGTIYDLMEIEHAYAPPFSSAKDPLAIAGYAASHVSDGTLPTVSWRELEATDKSKITLIDTRTAHEYELGSIPGALHVPLDEMRAQLDTIPKDKPIVLFCAVGLRGYLAQRILSGNGFENVSNLSGGFRHWHNATEKHESTKALFPLELCACTQVEEAQQAPATRHIVIDACDLQCPGPILKIKTAMDKAQHGERVEVKATDAAFPRDAQAWSKSTGHKIVNMCEKDGIYSVTFEKGGIATENRPQDVGRGNHKTLIMFSDDLDKAIATFILANGAATTGAKVSIFFTFWGLSTIKKTPKPIVKKGFWGKIFDMMLPASSKGLHLSKMSMLGIGDRLIRKLMKENKVSSLEELRDQALANGVEFIACKMSMDLMGIQQEELLDGVEIGGVASYMERAENAAVNLFI